MAAVAVILGGMAGFMSGLVALILFNASWLLALGLWSFGGLAVFGVLIALALPPRLAPPEIEAEHA